MSKTITPNPRTVATLASQPAFPTLGFTQGMPFRNWLIGQVAAGLAHLDQLNADGIAEEAIKTADRIIERLAVEKDQQRFPPCPLVSQEPEPYLDLDALEAAGGPEE